MALHRNQDEEEVMALIRNAKIHIGLSKDLMEHRGDSVNARDMEEGLDQLTGIGKKVSVLTARIGYLEWENARLEKENKTLKGMCENFSSKIEELENSPRPGNAKDPKACVRMDPDGASAGRETGSAAHYGSGSKAAGDPHDETWLIIERIGSTGMTDYPEIEIGIIKDFPGVSVGRLREAFRKLRMSDVIERDPGASRPSDFRYHLTEFGKKVYRENTGHEAKEPEFCGPEI